MTNVLSVVVDADIARSSGLTEHPVSSGSRALLENLANNGHNIAFCKTMLAEWRTHRSRFATKWLAMMHAKKRVQRISPEQHTQALIEDNIADNSKVEIASKDAHLIDAALMVDKVIASNDDNARTVFCELSTSCGIIRDIKWFNAIADRAFIEDYLVRQNFVPERYYVRSAG